jgi:hypothetical protein
MELIRRSLRHGLLAVLAVLALACGKKAAPLPPGIKAPPPVEGFRATVRGYEVRLSWMAPPLRRGEERPTDVIRYLLYRENVLEREAADCNCRQWEPLDTVDLEYPSNAFVEDGRVEYILPLAGYERSRIYAFTVAAQNRYGVVSPLAPDRVLNLGPPPPPVTGIEARVGETWVDLTWPPVAKAASYRLYRFAPGEAQPDTPYASTDEPQFIDRQVVLGQPYAYVVTAVGEGRYPAESRPSATVTATPRDLTPPAAPVGLIAVAAGTEVRLSWEPSGEVDLASYRVWRSASSATPKAVARVKAERTNYSDIPPTPGTYRYHLTAVDRSGNESSPSAEVEVVAVHP